MNTNEINSDEWYDGLTTFQKVAIWNKYVQTEGSREDYDMIFQLNEETLDSMFPSASAFAMKLGMRANWNFCHPWWSFNRYNGFVYSFEDAYQRLKDDELREWATSAEAIPALFELDEWEDINF